MIIHEVTHGYVAGILGDPTAKLEGRLTLNPIKHIDLFGSIVLPLLLLITNAGFLFGWAKPVPYNPYNLKAGKWGPAIVAGAGPVSNLLIAILFAIFLKMGIAYEMIGTSTIPLLIQIVQINVVLGIFNLVPIPPLDGSKVLFAFLPYKWNYIKEALERYSLFVILFVVLFGFKFIAPIINWFLHLIL